jgi:WD40 repeat protein
MYLAALNTKRRAGTAQYSVCLFCGDTYELRGVARGHTDDVRRIAFDNTGSLMATGSRDKTARLWDLTAMTIDPGVREVAAFPHEQDVKNVIIHENRDRLLTLAADYKIVIWNIATQDQLITIQSSRVRCLSMKGNMIYHLCAEDEWSELFRHDADTGQLLWRLKSYEPRCIQLSPSCDVMALTDAISDGALQEHGVKRTIYVRDIDLSTLLGRIECSPESDCSIWSLDGQFLAVMDSNVIFIYNTRSRASTGSASPTDLLSPVIRIHCPHVVMSAFFSADNTRLAVAGIGGNNFGALTHIVVVYDTCTGAQIIRLDDVGKCAQFSPQQLILM